MKRIFNKETRDYDVVPSENYGLNKYLVSDSDGNPRWEDRLAYSLPEEVVTVLEETTVEYDERDWVNRSISGVELVEGAEYTVMWNGTAYVSTCIKHAFFGSLWIGNPAVLGEGGNNNMPFAVAVSGSGCDIGRLNTDEAETVTISIMGRIRNYKKIDTEYLPTLSADDVNKKGIVSPAEIIENTTAQLYLDIGITNMMEVRDALRPMGILSHNDIDYRVLGNTMKRRADGSTVITASCAEYGLVYLKCWFNRDTQILTKIQIVPCGYAPIAKDTNGNFWKIKVSTDGALSTELYEIPTYESEDDGGLS